MKKLNMTDAELDAVAGGARENGGVGGVAGITDAELDAVAGGDRENGGVGGVAG